MKNFFITTMLVLGLVACEDTTNTTTEATSEETQESTFTGANGSETTTPTEATTEQIGETTENETQTTPTEVETGTETEVDPTETEVDPTETEVDTEPEDTTEVEEAQRVTVDDLTVEELAEIDVLRDNIFAGISVGEDLYIKQVNLALEELGLFNGDITWGADETLPEVSTCPFVEFYDNEKPLSEASCEYLVDQARSEAYSKLAATLQTERENFNSTMSEQDFWYEQGAVSGLEKSRVVIQVQMKTESICNQTPTASESSMEKGLVVGRQHFVNSMNNWLTTNGHKGDYPVMSEPIEVCDANASMLNPVYDEALNSISQAMTTNPLCADYEPSTGDEELKYAQAQSDFSKAIEQGIEDEFSLAAVKIFEVVPCNVSDPIILDLNGNGVFDITQVERGVNFAMTGTRPSATSWLQGDGFLFNDANGNGVVDNGTEFFGTTGQEAFAQLKAFDTNGDRQITPADAGYNKLFVWIDRDYNGTSLTTEVFSLSHFNIQAIPLQTSEYQKVVNGSRIKNSVTATTKTGTMLFGDVDFRAGIYHSPAIYRQTQTPLK